MNAYEQRVEARRARLEARADRLAGAAKAKIESGFGDLRSIPFGQPILVGHHSEKRDRNFRRKAGARIDAGMALQKAAGEIASRAAAVGTGGISSDDPEAVAKLKEELVPLEARQARMAAANKLFRKGDVEGLKAMGFAEATIEKLMVPPYPSAPRGFQAFELSNNGANIRRIKARIADLEKAATREAKETTINGVRIVENVEANRLQMFFPGKPSEEVRSQLKSRGFRWSPSEGAWQRQLSNGAAWIAAQVAEKVTNGQ